MNPEENPHTPGTPEHADWRMLREHVELDEFETREHVELDEFEQRIRRAEETAAERAVEHVDLSERHLVTISILLAGSREDAESTLTTLTEHYPILGLAECTITQA